MLAEINPTQHTDCANYLFADGHADMVTMETFNEWVQQDVTNVAERRLGPILPVQISRQLTFYQSQLSGKSLMN